MTRFAPISPNKDQGIEDASEYKYGWHDTAVAYAYKAPKGLREAVVRDISSHKNEPQWMLAYRLEGLKHFLEKPLPAWGIDLSPIDFDQIHYYLKPADKVGRTWEDVPDAIKTTFERLGIPEAERKYLAGVKSQYDSEVIYGSLKQQLSEQGVIFLSMDEGLVGLP